MALLAAVKPAYQRHDVGGFDVILVCIIHPLFVPVNMVGVWWQTHPALFLTFT